MLSPSLDSEYLTSLEEVPADWLTEIAPAMQSLAVAYRAVATARGDIMDDVTKTEPARLLTLDQVWKSNVAPRVEAANKALDAFNELPTMIAKERMAVFPQPQDQAGIVVASEIRSALFKLDDKQRRAVL